ncbi:MAG: hypothetical protein L0Y77_08500 [Chlorobi bacterium]|nr:hypothetical protein [Chlorobiota bacterium]
MKKSKRPNLKTIKTIEGKKHDIVRVSDFSVTPPEIKRKQTVTIRMTIKNVSDKALKGVPWQIVKNKKILDSGVRYNLASGDSFKVLTTWTATAGSHFFYGDADPKNTLREPKIKQYNNLPQGFDVKVR